MNDFISMTLKGYFQSADARFLEKIKHRMPDWHLRMLSDKGRLNFYQSIISHQVKGKTVLDIGAGTGILTWLAVNAGAEKVFAVERDEFMQELIGNFLAKEIDTGKVVLLKKDATHLTRQDLPISPEVVLHEIFAGNGVGEGAHRVFSKLHADHLIGNAAILPSCLRLIIQPVNILNPGMQISYEDYQGFPLSKLNPFTEFKETFLNFHWSRSLTMTPAGERKTLCEINFPKLSPLTELSVVWDRPVGPCTHLRLWIELEEGSVYLSSDHLKEDSHWSNLLFQMPGRVFQTAHFEFAQDRMTLKSIS
jgi:hypothetical protein